MLTKLNKEDITVNEPVEWPVYSSSGRLLLQPGQAFNSDGLIEALLWRGLYRGNKTSFASGEYKKIVDIEKELSNKKDSQKAGQNYNKEYSALLNKQSHSEDNLFQENKFQDFNEDEFIKNNGGSEYNLDLDNEARVEKNITLLNESSKQELMDAIKDDVIKLVRSELESFFKSNVNEKVQKEINSNVYQDMQQSVISTLGGEIDGKIKKEVNRFITDEYHREKNNPINRLAEISSQLELVFAGLEECSPESVNAILIIAFNIQELCMDYPDAMLMSIHLYNKGSYTIRHPIDMAILCELISLRQGITDKEHRQFIVASALTCDFSMRDMQKILQTQSAALNNEQREEIGYHTVQSVAMLLSAGVTDALWLDTVAQHHERIDGSGYPLQYKGDKISEGAKILAICDRYCSMVTGRTYRNALHGKDALGVFLSEEKELYDKSIVVMLISEISIYPPGSFVQLINGETAVVTHRGAGQAQHSKVQPTVLSFSNAGGEIFDTPIIRECNDKKYQVQQTVLWEKHFPLSTEDVWVLSSQV